MTDSEKLTTLIAAGEKMRDLQKKFFRKEYGDMRERSVLIKQSQQAEKEFDKVLYNLKQMSEQGKLL